MKLITLHQPWASLVALGIKKYETRHWETNYRGPLLIHAAKRDIKAKEFGMACRFLSAEQVGDIVEHAYDNLGVIIAIADLTNCQRMITCSGNETPGEIAIPTVSPLEKSVGDWAGGRYALQLDNVYKLENPVPFKSRQGKLIEVPGILYQHCKFMDKQLVTHG